MMSHELTCLACTMSRSVTLHRCVITACAVYNSNKLLYRRCAFSMGEGKFRPHSSHIFLPIFLKLKTKKHIQDVNPHAKFSKDRLTGGIWTNTLILAVHSGLPFLYFFVFFAHRPGRIARPTATNEGSKRVFPAKEVPFGVLQ